MRLPFHARMFVGAGLVLAGPIAACSSPKGTSFSSSGSSASVNPSEGSGSNGSDSDAGSSSPNGSGSGSSSGDNPIGQFVHTYSDAGNSGPNSADAACAFSSQMGKQQGLDAYMMLDYSGSMQMDGKWTGVTGAINSFVAQPTTGISVGLQYFGLPDPDAGTGLFGLTLGDSCNPAVYAKPEIEISPLPGIGAMITQSLAMHTKPNTSTPTPAALQGAINHASDWAKAHPADATIAILATDGDPTECGSTNGASMASLLSDVEAIAAAGVAATPKILTFVIGVGTETANLNGIAMAGGTNSAFIVDTSMNISTQFLAALNKIRGAALGCQYKVPVPTTGTTNFSEVNVQFTASGGKPELVPQVADKGHCPASSNAWYYDNPSSPTEIILCTTTCGTVATGGEVDVLTGCQTVVMPEK
jgi:Mg-chelatase subunit ChlD